MPEFKLVVSNPSAKPIKLKVKVKGDENLSFTQQHKERRVLATAKLSPKLIEKLEVKDGVVTITLKTEEGKKVNLHLKVEEDGNLDETTVLVPMDLIGEKIGEFEADGEISPSKAFQLVLDDERSRRLLGMRIKDEISASIIGLKGKLVITGGTDNSGFPMRPDIPGGAKKRVLLSGPPGYRPTRKGERKRKTVRGNLITEDIVQVNTVWRHE